MFKRIPKFKQQNYELLYTNKDTGGSGLVGVGWSKEDGSIEIKFNLLVEIPNRSTTILTLHRKE